MTDFSQLGIRNRGKLILFLNISKFGIRVSQLGPQCHLSTTKVINICLNALHFEVSLRGNCVPIFLYRDFWTQEQPNSASDG